MADAKPTQPDPELFTEFLTANQQNMIQLRSIFNDMTRSGFSEGQACAIIGHMLAGLTLGG